MTATLFSRLCSPDHLFRAWEHVKSKKSSGGIDGETVRGFEESLRDNHISGWRFQRRPMKDESLACLQ